ncbi:MAG: multicopper oxidase domain-containing protein [Thaumarchaeota archaeon]|nr:multicopper oxidase domain-containing protein [Nitrososphaerota archaeon]
MNKGIIIGIVVVAIIVVGAAAFLAMPQGPQAPQARTINLEAREFSFKGLGFDKVVCDLGTSCGPTITLKAGETVRVVLKNIGGADHEFMVAEEGALKEKAAMHEPIFKEAMSEETKPGQTSTITFVAEKAGKYIYGCFLDVATKPDRHADRGMWGEFMVEA